MRFFFYFIAYLIGFRRILWLALILMAIAIAQSQCPGEIVPRATPAAYRPSKRTGSPGGIQSAYRAFSGPPRVMSRLRWI